MYALPTAKPRRRRGGIRRRRRNPSGGGLSLGQIALATVAGATSFVGSAVLIPRLIPRQLETTPVRYGIGMMLLGVGLMFLLRKYPVVALASGVPITGGGLVLAGTGLLAQSQPKPAAQGAGANLGAVVLEDIARLRGMGAVVNQRALQMSPAGRQLIGMGAVVPASNPFSNGSMGAVEALVSDARFSSFRAPSVARGMNAM